MAQIYLEPEGITNVGGRPGLNVDFVAVCDAVTGARKGSQVTMSDISDRFKVSRAWLHKWVYPSLLEIH